MTAGCFWLPSRRRTGISSPKASSRRTPWISTLCFSVPSRLAGAGATREDGQPPEDRIGLLGALRRAWRPG